MTSKPVDDSASKQNTDHDPLQGRKLRIGIISPYSFETPGGVQFHIRDFAQELISRGHAVEVLAPGRRTTDMPLWVHTTGSSFSIPYNGSVAHLSYFGVAGMLARKWVRQGHFDLVHLHEPEVPSLSHKPLVMGFEPCPYVATFHAAFDTYPLALRICQSYLRSYLANVRAAICVSDSALDTARRYLRPSTPMSIIPNGINVQYFASATINPDWLGYQDHPTIGFLGRMGEERKGFDVFIKACSLVLQRYPHARFLCVGDGEAEGRKIIAAIEPAMMDHVEFLGRISDEDKARFYRSLSVYVAPQLGGESFGIVLAEAMAAGCPVGASDLKAFTDISKDGRAASLFRTGEYVDCAHAVEAILDDSARSHELSTEGMCAAFDYDWSSVADQILQVYADVLTGWRLRQPLSAQRHGFHNVAENV
ncbi:MAG: glycosyltransferase family 4 protein [Bifidobacterium aquikefiri]|uniref:glycosyltransferase family 4 protein n=1 Tax=Bifidobacterium aquikefiri TaxID=1653207 RepID=UPI0039EBDA4B